MISILQIGDVAYLFIFIVFALVFGGFIYLWVFGEIPEESAGQHVEEKKFCPTCGLQVKLVDSFCLNCGHSLSEETEGKQLCLVCDTKADVSDEFCSNCGNSLSA